MALELREARLARSCKSFVCSLIQPCHENPGSWGTSNECFFTNNFKASATTRAVQNLEEPAPESRSLYAHGSWAASRIILKACLVLFVLNVFDRRNLPVLARYSPWSGRTKASWSFSSNFFTRNSRCRVKSFILQISPRKNLEPNTTLAHILYWRAAWSKSSRKISSPEN